MPHKIFVELLSNGGCSGGYFFDDVTLSSTRSIGMISKACSVWGLLRTDTTDGYMDSGNAGTTRPLCSRLRDVAYIVARPQWTQSVEARSARRPNLATWPTRPTADRMKFRRLPILRILIVRPRLMMSIAHRLPDCLRAAGLVRAACDHAHPDRMERRGDHLRRTRGRDDGPRHARTHAPARVHAGRGQIHHSRARAGFCRCSRCSPRRWRCRRRRTCTAR